MIHPKTTLKFINDQVGYGVFATEFIPEGSIVYVKDKWEIVVRREEYQSLTSDIRDIFERFSYIDEKGNRIISWDIAKYVNHCCNSNTISTGYGFEIAIRDIQKGEEITDEYGIFNLENDIELICDKPGCRKVVRSADFETFYREWDEKIKSSLMKLHMVNQPLLQLLNKRTMAELDQFFKDHTRYKSVYALRYNGMKVLKNGLHNNYMNNNNHKMKVFAK